MKYRLIIILFFISNLLIAGLQEDFNFAKKLYDEELYNQAVNEFKTIIRKSRTSPEADKSQYYIGRAYFKLAEFDKAEKAFKKHLNGYPFSRLKKKSIHNLGFSHFKQKEYQAALNYFQKLITDYPTTEISENNIKYIPLSYLNLKKYDKTIETSERLTNDYPESDNIPRLSFLKAKALFHKKELEASEKLLDKIIHDYETFNARWEAILFKANKILKTQNLEYYINFLEQYNTDQTPRKYQEIYLFAIANAHIKNNQYLKAYQNLKRLINKFNNSSDLAKYITTLNKTRIELEKYGEIIDSQKEYKNLLKDSEYFFSNLFFVSKAYFLKNESEKYQQYLNLILSKSKNKALKYKTIRLKSEIEEARENYFSALEQLNLIVSNYNDFANLNEIYMKIGDIHYLNLKLFNKALKSYRKIKSDKENELYPEAIYKISLCYEILEEYDMAAQNLKKIDIETIKNPQLKNKIKLKKQYLHKFKIENYKNAFSNLILAINNDYDKSDLTLELSDILMKDIKDFENSLMILDQDTPAFNHQKAKIYLQLAEKSKLNGDNRRFLNYIAKTENIVNALKETSLNRSYWTEIDLRKKIVASKDTLSASLVSELDNFVKNNNNSDYMNYFLLTLADSYKNENLKKSVSYLKMIQNKNNIPDYTYYDAQKQIADFYYKKEEYEKALNYYKKISQQITPAKPRTYYRYALCLYKTGFENEAVSKMEFIMKNSYDLMKNNDLIIFLADYFFTNENFEKAYDYYSQIPQNKRNPDYYRHFSTINKKLGNFEKALKSLMHIEEKEQYDLINLGNLQLKTGNPSLAVYTFQQYLENAINQEDKITAYQKIANTYFQMEEYRKAVKNYNKILSSNSDNFIDKQDFKSIVKNTIISYYRIENRPKAENILEKYEDNFDENSQDYYEIKMEKAVYYVNNDTKEGIDLLEDFLEEETTDKLSMKAYFWLGTAYMKLDKLDKAISAFENSKIAENRNLRNNTYLKLGTIYFSKENFNRSLEHYFYVIQNDTSGDLAVTAAKNFAIVSKKIKEWQKAINAYELILDKWGDKDIEGKTLFDIGFCYYRDKQFYKAVETFQKALPLIKDRATKAEAQFWIGDSYFSADNYEKAAAAFLKVNYNYSEIPQLPQTAQLKAGDCYVRMGNIEQAKQIFNKIISRYGRNSDWGKEAVEKLSLID